MSIATLARQVSRLRTEVQTRTAAANPALEVIRRDSARIMTSAGMASDPWQQSLLRSRSQRMLLLCSRQAGKSTTAAALALKAALLEAPALVLILSPTERQSAELLAKVRELWEALGRPVSARMHGDKVLSLVLANGSRIIALPGVERTIRGFSGVRLLVIDEAARVDDGLFYSTRPMLAVSGGRLIALSTPFGKRGWFFEQWTGDHPWERVKITAPMCPRIAPAFLEEERQTLGARWFQQEYMCSFEETIDAVFSHADVMAALSDTVQPLFGS